VPKKICGSSGGFRLMAFKTISLQQFGRLMAVFPIGRIGERIAWVCLCDCGNTKSVVADNLTRGLTKSCGCLHRESAASRGHIRWTNRTGEQSPSFKHGHCLQSGQSLTYNSWVSMITRCTNPNARCWVGYGSEGVTVCERWQGEHGFENFLADLGERPSRRHSLGRFGDVGNYEPGNCAWQTYEEQWIEQKKKRKFAAVAA
jgi:hypothetical protein